MFLSLPRHPPLLVPASSSLQPPWAEVKTEEIREAGDDLTVSLQFWTGASEASWAIRHANYFLIRPCQFRTCFENYSKNVVNVKFLLTISYQVLFPSSIQTRLANMITICLCFHRRIVECIVSNVPFIFSAKEFFHGCLDPSWKYFINVCILNICWCFTCWTVLFCLVRQQGRR